MCSTVAARPIVACLGVLVCLLCLQSCRCVADVQLYDLLGVEPSATAKQIKKAYRSKSVELHPDKHPAAEKDQWEAKFIELVNAYNVLSDEETRRQYDSGALNADGSFRCAARAGSSAAYRCSCHTPMLYCSDFESAYKAHSKFDVQDTCVPWNRAVNCSLPHIRVRVHQATELGSCWICAVAELRPDSSRGCSQAGGQGRWACAGRCSALRSSLPLQTSRGALLEEKARSAKRQSTQARLDAELEMRAKHQSEVQTTQRRKARDAKLRAQSAAQPIPAAKSPTSKSNKRTLLCTQWT